MDFFQNAPPDGVARAVAELADYHMDISVVIVGWNARHYLELCLKSLADAPPRRSMEVLVVDNASSDGSSEMIKAQFPWVKLIRSEENLGFAKGNNVRDPAMPGTLYRAGKSGRNRVFRLSGRACGFPRSKSEGWQRRSSSLES